MNRLKTQAPPPLLPNKLHVINHAHLQHLFPYIIFWDSNPRPLTLQLHLRSLRLDSLLVVSHVRKTITREKVIGRQHLQETEVLAIDDVDIRINIHYGILSTGSILAFDPIQRILAVASSDGRIKLVGGDNFEGLLVSPKHCSYKHLEFLQNQGFLVSITGNNCIEVWDLDKRSVACSLRWESNITAFSAVTGSFFMYVGDDHGLISVFKYDAGIRQLFRLPYKLPSDSLIEATGISDSKHQSVVNVLPQPCTLRNRILIAYRSGVIILWDVDESRSASFLSHKDLQLKHRVVIPKHDTEDIILKDVSWYDLEKKEITSLCWVSRDGSILAIGYKDGDILLWDLSKSSTAEEQGVSSNICKLRLSSADKRSPVISLVWLDNSKSGNSQGGELFVYGGGLKEVVTVLNLEWSSISKDVRCKGRKELSLRGSFADMKLISSASTQAASAKDASLFVLSKPGCIHIYDTGSLWTVNSISGHESSISFPSVIPIVDPVMTVSKCFYFYGSICEMSPVLPALSLPGNKSWPITGGVSNDRHSSKNKINRLYIASYQDGTVRIWDTTRPVFQLSCVLSNQAKLENFVDSMASSISALDLSSSTLTLAIGRECGLVQLYDLSGSDETRCYFISGSRKEVCSSVKDTKGPKCTAIFKLHISSVQAMKFTNEGSKLVVGFSCSRIALLDVQSYAVVFLKDPISNSPVASVLHWKDFSTEPSKTSKGELILMLTIDSSFCAIDGYNGNTIQLMRKSNAISIHVIESHSLDNNSVSSSYVLLCCKDSLRLYSAKSLFQATSKSVHKVKLSKPCCWTAYFRKNELICGLIVFYQTGVLEIRSLPYLQVLVEYPLISNLRWNFKWDTNMEKIITSTEEGDVILSNGSEVVFISVLESENSFRIQESHPSFHDPVLAAAPSSTISSDVSDPKKKQVRKPGIMGAIKGLKVRKPSKHTENGCDSNKSSIQLEDIFARDPFPETSVWQLPELNIDDIEIDEPGNLECSSSSTETGKRRKSKKSKSEKILVTQRVESMPRMRSQQEILAKYRQSGEVSSVAGDARNKLIERQEKLEKITRSSENLRSSAEEFSSMADDLVKVLESRKWYHL